VLDDRPPLPVVYVSLMQQWQGTARNLIVRGYGGDATALADPVKRAVVGADAFAEAYGARTMEQIVAEILYPRRLAAGILGTAGVIGLTLASIGLYGVVSFSVARRRREIGIRATLGASRRDILALILREGAVVAGIGCAAGLALGVLALRLTAGLIPDLPTVDVLAFVAVPAALTLVVLAACYVPARRAARVDPAEVLRSL
jgi:ABC-type antimicrobial peptide transport system permease subunit